MPTTRVPCLPDQFPCKNGYCIPRAELCDRVDQCGDGSDETYNCTGEQLASLTVDVSFSEKSDGFRQAS